jgi:hypothetical protein
MHSSFLNGFDYFLYPVRKPQHLCGDSRNRKHQLLIEDRVKALPFLTGFTNSSTFSILADRFPTTKHSGSFSRKEKM